MPSLSRAEAEARAALVAVSSYVVDLDLTGGDDEAVTTYRSHTRVRFTCRQPGAATFADLSATRVHAMRLNGRDLPQDAWVDGRLALTGLAADNVLVVEADMPLRRDGQGLHRAIDPADGQAYIYGHLFLDAAPSVAVCFDQPDLKAPWTISVTTPQRWQVVGNAAVTSPAPGRFELATTQPLSTYFVTICAGPYVSVIGEHDGIRLGLHTRASLRAELERDAPRLLELTGRFFDEYHELFGIRYPFGEYHHVFVPEFNALAMENPGCVTIRDELLFRGQATPDEVLSRDSTIAHEMAHMWFGDLVTMQWWDDLWLNESFAEYLAARVLVSTGIHPNAWVNTTMERRPWGYAAERSPSTHPVAGSPALDAQTALQDFDGISYAKGAAVLRQLIAYVGDDAFVAGVRAHLARNAFGNATMADFLGAIAAAAGRDLGSWRDAWLLTAGRDTLSAVVADQPGGPDGHAGAEGPAGARGRVIEVRRIRPVAGEVPDQVDCFADRPHATDVAGYADGVELFRVPVTTTGDVTRVLIPPGVDPASARLVVPNASDLTWAALDLSAGSMAALSSELPLVADPQVRASVWVALGDAVARAQMAAASYVEVFCSAWPRESDASILQRVALSLTRFVRDFVAPEAREVARGRIAAAALGLLESAAPLSAQSIAAARVVATVSGDEALLRSWLAGSGLPAGLDGDSDFLWLVIGNLCARGLLDASGLELAAARDQTLQGGFNALHCRASMPDQESKAWAWGELTGRNVGHSNFELNHLAQGFWQFEDPEIVRPYVERYFDEVPAMHEWVGEDALARVAQLAFPAVIEDATRVLSMRALERADLTPAVRRAMIDADWKLHEALAARRRFG